jgi:hypothetical protein
MSDVAQILGIQAPVSSGTNGDVSNLHQLASSKPKKAKNRGKRLKGMHREVMELLENNHRANHALYPGVNKKSLVQKWRENKGKPAVKWYFKIYYLRLSRIANCIFSFSFC